VREHLLLLWELLQDSSASWAAAASASVHALSWLLNPAFVLGTAAVAAVLVLHQLRQRQQQLC
jgi:hypothetical protein